MKLTSVVHFIAFAVIFACMIVSCSKGSGSPVVPGTTTDSRVVSGGIIALGSPEISGDVVSYPLEITNADDLYAFSFRVGFDQTGLSPVNIEWTELVTDEDAVFTLLDRPGFIPVAYSKFSGNYGLTGDGILCTVTFNVLDPENSTPWIIGDEDFLVAKNNFGDSVILEAGGEVQ